MIPTTYIPSIRSYNMKRLIPILLVALSLASCGKKETTTEQITKLKKERADIDIKIRTLEAKSGTKDSIKAIPVAITSVMPQSFESYIDVQASIVSDENTYATPQAPG